MGWATRCRVTRQGAALGGGRCDSGIGPEATARAGPAPFWVAPLVRGAGVDDPPHPIPRVAGVPTSLLGAAATSITAVAGWLLDRRAG